MVQLLPRLWLHCWKWVLGCQPRSSVSRCIATSIPLWCPFSSFFLSLTNKDSFHPCMGFHYIIYRCFQPSLNFLHQMIELFELDFYNILIGMGSHYRHKLLMSRYVVRIRLFNFFLYYNIWRFILSMWICCFDCWHFMIRFTLMLLPGSLIHLLFWGNLLSSPC